MRIAKPAKRDATTGYTAVILLNHVYHDTCRTNIFHGNVRGTVGEIRQRLAFGLAVEDHLQPRTSPHAEGEEQNDA